MESVSFVCIPSILSLQVGSLGTIVHEMTRRCSYRQSKRNTLNIHEKHSRAIIMMLVGILEMLVGIQKRVIQPRQEVKDTRRQGSLSGERIFFQF